MIILRNKEFSKINTHSVRGSVPGGNIDRNDIASVKSNKIQYSSLLEEYVKEAKEKYPNDLKNRENYVSDCIERDKGIHPDAKAVNIAKVLESVRY